MRKSKLGEGCGEAMRDDSMMEWGGRVEGGTEKESNKRAVLIEGTIMG